MHGIALEIARDAPERAVKICDALLDRAEQAAEFPLSGRVVREFKRDDLRELIQSPFRIIYRVRADEVVEVVRFWHAKRGTPEP